MAESGAILTDPSLCMKEVHTSEQESGQQGGGVSNSILGKSGKSGVVRAVVKLLDGCLHMLCKKDLCELKKGRVVCEWKGVVCTPPSLQARGGQIVGPPPPRSIYARGSPDLPIPFLPFTWQRGFGGGVPSVSSNWRPTCNYVYYKLYIMNYIIYNLLFLYIIYYIY